CQGFRLYRREWLTLVPERGEEQRAGGALECARLARALPTEYARLRIGFRSRIKRLSSEWWGAAVTRAHTWTRLSRRSPSISVERRRSRSIAVYLQVAQTALGSREESLEQRRLNHKLSAWRRPAV